MTRFSTPLVALLVLAAPLLAQDGEKERAVAILAGAIHLGDGTVLTDGVVVVSGGKIVAVGPGADVVIPDGAARVRAAAVTPGLIDASAGALLPTRTTPQDSEVIPSTRVLEGLDPSSRAMRDLAREGVTTVFVPTGDEAVVGSQGAVLRTGEGPLRERVLVEAGAPRLNLVSGPQAGNSRPFSPTRITAFTRVPLGRMGMVFVARDAFGGARETAERLEAEAATDAADAVDPDTRVLIDVMKGERALQVIARREFEIATALRLGREFGFDFVLVEAPEAWRMRAQIAAAKVPVILGPLRSEPQRKIPPQLRRFFAVENIEERHGTARELLDDGVPLALTARGATGEYGLVQQGMWARRYGLSLAEVVRALTATPAKLLGVDDRVGTIAVGKDADLVIWRGEPFSATGAPQAVLVGGRRIEARTF